MTNPSPAPLHDPSTFTRGVPFELIEQLRAAGPVHWVDEPELPGLPAGPGYHLVIDHAAVTDVVKDPAGYSSALGGTQIHDPATPRDLAYVRRMMLNMDPPEHTRLRKMIAASFTPRAVRGLEQQIAQHARAIVDRMLDGPHECDFAKDVAADLPLLTLADILGVPAEDRWLMFDWSNRVIGFLDPDYASSASFDATQGSSLAQAALALRPSPDADGRMPDPRGRDGMPDLYHYAHLLADAKRAEPGHDVMSILLAQRADDGGGLTDPEFENMFWLFAVAGNETLRNGLPGAMIGLLEHPDAQRRLRDDPALIPVAVEELLRWWTPVMTFRRTATHDTELHGTAIRGGDKVVVSYLGANRDPAVFDVPASLIITRKPNNHRVFGHGPHVCVGAHFARVQMTYLLREVLTRTSDLQLAGEPALLRSNFQRGVKRLPIHWSR